MVMKVIFLDNDGVICLSNNWGSRHKKQNKWGGRKLSMSMSSIPIEYRFDNFDEKAVKILNEILEETDAEIVVSSDWQNFATLDELGEYYESQGIIKRPIGVTKEVGALELEGLKDFPWHRGFDLEQHRSLEILQWLKHHPEVTNWVAVDDLNMGKHVEASYYDAHDRDWGLTNFVWTPRINEGIKQSGVSEKIINFLTK
jgi:hypothetical protein